MQIIMYQSLRSHGCLNTRHQDSLACIVVKRRGDLNHTVRKNAFKIFWDEKENRNSKFTMWMFISSPLE